MFKKLIAIIILFASLSIPTFASSDENTLEQVEALVRPSVARVYSRTCNLFRSGTELEYCHTTIGDGVYVSSDGYILTNTDVAFHTTDDIVESMIRTSTGASFYLDNIYPINNPAAANEDARQALIDQILVDDSFRSDAVEETMDTILGGLIGIEETSRVSVVEKDGTQFELDSGMNLINAGDHLEVNNTYTNGELPLTEGNTPIVLQVEIQNHPTLRIDNLPYTTDTNYFQFGHKAISGSGFTSDFTALNIAPFSGGVVVDTVNEIDGSLISVDQTSGLENLLFIVKVDSSIAGILGEYQVYDTPESFYFSSEYITSLRESNSLEFTLSETDAIWRNLVRAFYEEDYDATVELANQILEIYPDHNSAGIFRERASLQVEEPATEETDNQLLLLLRQFVSSDITEDQLPLIIGGLIGGVLTVFVALYLIRRLFRKNDQLPKMPDATTSNVKSTDDILQNEDPEPVMQQAAPPVEPAQSTALNEEATAKPHVSETPNTQDTTAAVQPSTDQTAGEPSTPVVPQPSEKVRPHPGEMTPNLVSQNQEEKAPFQNNTVPEPTVTPQIAPTPQIQTESTPEVSNQKQQNMDSQAVPTTVNEQLESSSVSNDDRSVSDNRNEEIVEPTKPEPQPEVISEEDQAPASPQPQQTTGGAVPMPEQAHDLPKSTPKQGDMTDPGTGYRIVDDENTDSQQSPAESTQDENIEQQKVEDNQQTMKDDPSDVAESVQIPETKSMPPVVAKPDTSSSSQNDSVQNMPDEEGGDLLTDIGSELEESDTPDQQSVDTGATDKLSSIANVQDVTQDNQTPVEASEVATPVESQDNQEQQQKQEDNAKQQSDQQLQVDNGQSQEQERDDNKQQESTQVANNKQQEQRDDNKQNTQPQTDKKKEQKTPPPMPEPQSDQKQNNQNKNDNSNNNKKNRRRRRRRRKRKSDNNQNQQTESKDQAQQQTNQKQQEDTDSSNQADELPEWLKPVE